MRWLTSPRTPATSTPSFLLATLGHAGTVHIDLKVAPEVVGIFRGLPIALAKGRRARGAHAITVCLREGGSSGCDGDKPQRQHCDTFDDRHDKVSYLDGLSLTSRGDPF